MRQCCAEQAGECGTTQHSTMQGRARQTRQGDAGRGRAGQCSAEARPGRGRVLLKGGGPRGVGGWGCAPPPPPAGDPELLEAPKAPNNVFGPN